MKKSYGKLASWDNGYDSWRYFFDSIAQKKKATQVYWKYKTLKFLRTKEEEVLYRKFSNYMDYEHDIIIKQTS